jgi:hypothetical protein
MNFTYDARLYDEYRWLNTDGDGGQNLVTAEFRAPFAGGKVPDDRIIDGIEMRDFFVGKTDKSGREAVVVYSGNDIVRVHTRGR